MSARPRILLLHGHGGDRHEARIAGASEGMLDRIAAPLAAAGFALIRPNLPGLRIPPQVDAAKAAVEGEGSLAVLGFSQGGLVALELSARIRIDALALLNPVLDPEAAFASFYAPEAPPPDFVTDLPALRPRGRLAAYDGPTLLLRSAGDRLARREDDPPGTVPLQGDHCLDATIGMQAIDLASEKITDFMTRNFLPEVLD